MSLNPVDNTTYFLDRQFWTSPKLVLLFSVTLFVIVLLRYLLLSSGYHLVIQRIVQSSSRKLHFTRPAQWKKEIRWSILSTIIFTVLSAGALWLYQRGLTKIYIDLADHSWLYFFFSIGLMLIGYETYYYWLHRWMHKPGIFRIVHKVHHESIETSVFTSFSFHPLEAFLQFLFLPIFIVLIPIHYYALGIVLTLWTISAIINHASVEIFPKKFNEHKIGRWLIGATHHDLHHKEFKTNYGLYFTFWDKWMNTESRNYDSRFQANTSEKTKKLSDLDHNVIG